MRLLKCAAILVLVGAGAAHAADAVSPFNWTGYYLGLTAGANWGQYDAQTSTIPDGYENAAQAAAVTAAGKQTIKATGFGAGIEGGYNWQTGNLLLGIEADLQAIHLNGAVDSGAVHRPGPPAGVAFTVTSYANTNWLFTARPRIGFVAPNHWLFYATGGLALTQLRSDFSYIDDNAALAPFPGVVESGQLKRLKPGYAVGGGIEAPLTDRLSCLKADYLHVEFANTAGSETVSDLQILDPGQVISHSGDLKADIVRAGLNYRFGDSGAPSSGDPIMPLKALLWKNPPSAFNDWQMETGARVWFSSGIVGAPQPGMQSQVSPSERLTYSGLDAITGEIFARVDHSSGLFVKGNLGAGAITRGQLDNEDFVGNGSGVQAYSHTLSSDSGDLGYATIDLGYNFLRTPAANVGAFVGYNYYAQALNTFGCHQIAAATVFCVPAAPSNFLSGPSENDHINSLRVGLSSEAMLTDRLKLTADAAYVPWANFSGLDDHLANQFLIFEIVEPRRRRDAGGDDRLLHHERVERRHWRTLLGLEFEYRHRDVRPPHHAGQ